MEENLNEQNNPQDENIERQENIGEEDMRDEAQPDESMDVPGQDDAEAQTTDASDEGSDSTSDSELQREPDYNPENEDVSPEPVSELGKYPEEESNNTVSTTFSSDSQLAELEGQINEAVEETDEQNEEATSENAEASTESMNEEYPEEESPAPATTLTQDQIVEAVLFSSDGPLPAAKVASVIGAISSKEIREIIDRLNCNYRQWNCSFRIEEIAGGFQMMTCPEYASYLQQLYKVRSESKLSAAALETLAVIAYKQPVLRAEIEAIRGVACGEMIRTLMEKDLIKIVGRAEELGRPMLYGTTKRFLQVFGLGSLEDLPKVPELLPPNKTAAKPQPEKTEETPAAVESEQPVAQTPESESVSETPTISEPESVNEPADISEQPSPETEADVPSNAEVESLPEEQTPEIPADETDEDADQKVE